MRINALIVDDEESSVEAIRDGVAWEKCGISEVFGAYSAKEARQIMDRESIQVLLCDIEMPGESGLEFIEWIREETRLAGQNMECVILTCYPEYSFMRKAMQLGCSDYLLKPLDYSELERVIVKAGCAVREHQTEESDGGPEGEGNRETGEDSDFSEQRKKETEDGTALIQKKVIPYIQENLTASFSVGDIAEYVALNPQYTMRLFKKTMGMSILEYVTQCRLEKAKGYLENTSYNNEIIAGKVGYVSSSYFIRLFKKQYGITPREYRKNRRTPK